jgi:alanine dehydrogenase
MTNAAPLWITEAEVVQLMSLPDAVAVLEQALRAEAAGQAASMDKTMLQFGASNLHALGGRVGDLVGTKSWAHTTGGTCPLLLLWNANDGQLAAVVEAFALGNLRTGGTSGLATEWLARPQSRVLAIAGAGKQALSQVAAVTAVRPIEEVRVFTRSAETRNPFADRIASELGLRAIACDTMQDACEGADVVTLVTRAKEPFLHAAMLARGTHVNAIGAIGPDRAEFAQDLFDRASVVVVDTLHSVRTLSREFATRFAERGWEEVRPLSGIVASGQRRPPDSDLTLFKAMGMGLSDVALGAAIVERARSAGAGRALAAPRKVKPRFAAVTKEMS